MKDSPIKILHLHPALLISSGLTRMIYQLMLYAGPHTSQYAATLAGDAIFKFKKNRLPVLKLFGGKNYLFYVFQFWQVFKFCKNNGVQLIHTHHRYFDCMAFIIAKLTGAKVVTSIQSKLPYVTRFRRLSKAFIVPSNAIKHHVQHKLGIPESKIALINNFISTDDLHLVSEDKVEEFMSSYRIPDNRTIIMYVGSLTKNKGIEVLLKTMKPLIREYTDLFLLIVGEGDQKEYIRKYCESKLSDFAIVGSQEELAPCYRVADIVVLPSLEDAFPLAVLEAGYFKKAVIASDVDGIPEIIDHGENGLLFKKANRDNLRSAFQLLLEDASLRVRLGNSLHRKVNNELLQSNKIPEYLELYKRVIESN